MSNRCIYCGGKVALDKNSSEVVCENCGRVIDTVEEGSLYVPNYHIGLLLSKKDLEVLHIIEGVKSRVGLSESVCNEAKYIARGITKEGIRCNSLELAFFSIYIACRGHNSALCNLICHEFFSMGLKVNEKNCIKSLTKFWNFYKFKRIDVQSYLSCLLEKIKSNQYIRNYINLISESKSKFLWCKVEELSNILIDKIDLGGCSYKVKAAATLFIACDQVFKSSSIENPITVEFLSYVLELNKNNLQKVLEKIKVIFYEELAQM